MTTDNTRWQRITEAFGHVADLSGAARDAALHALSTSDPDIHADVASLVESNDSVGDRFDNPQFHNELDALAEPAMSGRRIGPYLISREIGRGGMGAVWEAHRADEQYQKQVAIKMVAMGRDTEAMVRRFRQEREVLARLQHRNIAALLDGGMTDEGQPWFAMEYVEGEPITTWCDSHHLDVRQRVALFRQVCTATQYAHEHLIVHRDLKPNNILVATDGTVKLLDFGVAKLSDAGDAGLTGTAGVALTAAYASPEQLRGESVSTASDIYSLGVVLYELLTGSRPFSNTPIDTAYRTAMTPSRAVVASMSEVTGASVQRISQALQGDLDAIILMALRPEIDRRYRSVQQLNDDLQRALDGRQVLARPDTLGYRASSFVRRNRAVTGFAAIAVIALVTSTVVSLRAAQRARAERDRAVLETARTKQVTQFFQDVLSTPKPDQKGRDITVVEALDAVIPRIDSTFAASPDLRAAIKNTLGSTLHDMGLYDRARPLLEDALRIQERIDGDGLSRERADATYNLAGVETETSHSARAESLYRASLAMYARLAPDDSNEIYGGMNNLATAIQDQGRLAEAAALYGRVAAYWKLHPSRNPDQRNIALVNQATALTELGQFKAAEPVFIEAAADYERRHGPESVRLAQVLQPLAGAQLFQGKFAEAEASARRAWSIDIKALGETNPATVKSLRMLVNVLMDAGRCAEAIPLADQILALRGTVLPESDASIGTALLYGGWCRAQLGKHEAGERQLRDGLALRRKNFPAKHWAIAQGESLLGDALTLDGNTHRKEALTLLQSGFDGLRRELDSMHFRVRQAHDRLIHATGTSAQ